jgi:diketogulonate reductase-like aldo/keto reductase
METRRFGLTGMEVPVLGLGTWMMERDDRGAAVATIRKAVAGGASHIDTAEMYGSGRVEEIVGEALASIRDEVFLVTKVLPSNASFEGTIAACERSLRRLRTDHVDVYLLHWPGSHPLEETVRAFETLVADGKTRFFGVSNFDVDDMDDVVKIAGPGSIACNQVYYHLKERAIEHELMDWCATRSIPVVPYSPLGQGDFPEHNEVLCAIANAHGATPRQVALRFLLRDQNVFTIPKTSNPEHLKENLGAAELSLTDDDLRRLDEAFPSGRRRSLPVI